MRVNDLHWSSLSDNRFGFQLERQLERSKVPWLLFHVLVRQISRHLISMALCFPIQAMIDFKQSSGSQWQLPLPCWLLWQQNWSSPAQPQSTVPWTTPQKSSVWFLAFVKSKDYFLFLTNLYWNLADLIGIRVFKVKPTASKSNDPSKKLSTKPKIDVEKKLN